MSECAGLTEGEAVALTQQLSKMKDARVAVVVGFDDWLLKASAFEARVCTLCNNLCFPKRLESTNCDLKVITRKVAEAQNEITYLDI